MIDWRLKQYRVAREAEAKAEIAELDRLRASNQARLRELQELITRPCEACEAVKADAH